MSAKSRSAPTWLLAIGHDLQTEYSTVDRPISKRLVELLQKIERVEDEQRFGAASKCCQNDARQRTPRS
jgi:hypothetical protein